MLEKLAPTLPRRHASHREAGHRHVAILTEAWCGRWSSRASCPRARFQLICGSVGDLLDHLTCQDAVTFTGSAATGRKLKSHPAIIEHNGPLQPWKPTRSTSRMLGPDAAPGTEEFDLFVKEVAQEMTVKAGQKCTAIRRTLVPDGDGR